MIPNFIDRPKRWDAPFGPDQSDTIVNRLMSGDPFALMSATAFPKTTPLRGILKNDCRIVEFADGELIIRQGDYGNSAFLLLNGQALVTLKSIPANLLGRSEPRRRSVLSSITQLWSGSRIPERRDYGATKTQTTAGTATDSASGLRRAFLQDIPRVIDLNETETLQPGELFGELSAMTRTSRSATVFSKGRTELLEIRWQGLRDLMHYDDSLRGHIEKQYRVHSLQSHLREMPLLHDLPDDAMRAIVAGTEFETYGNFEWQNKFKSDTREDIADRILGEPEVAERGEYVNGLILIRNGFARVCRKEESGYRTVAYLGKGQWFGWREVAHIWQTKRAVPWQLSLRAVGYLDVLRIPTRVVEEHILPHVPRKQLPALLPTEANESPHGQERRMEARPESIETGMLEFLVEQRFINGTQAMLIDLDRCTRCDDCVRACAATHDGNPRFVREGTRHEQYLIANACMHCADPVCMIGCPTGAIGRDLVGGIVTINDNTCIGCSTCANSCPYTNIRMVEVRDANGRPFVDRERNLPIVKATKCDLCIEHLGGPACQRACPHDALVRIDLTTADQIKTFIQS